MQLITCDDWTEQTVGENEYTFAQTSDPRVLAVLQRDPYAQVSELYDGDAINPILYFERGGAHWVAGYDDGLVGVINNALEQFTEEVAMRYLWIFHGVTYLEASAPGDYDGSYLIATSPEFQEHVGNKPHPTKSDAIEDCTAIRDDLQDALDGYVYGSGWATLERRRLHDDEDIDISEWDVEIQCWGFVGEDYAKRTAAAFEDGTPSLPEMIEVTA